MAAWHYTPGKPLTPLGAAPSAWGLPVFNNCSKRVRWANNPSKPQLGACTTQRLANPYTGIWPKWQATGPHAKGGLALQKVQASGGCADLLQATLTVVHTSGAQVIFTATFSGRNGWGFRDSRDGAKGARLTIGQATRALAPIAGNLGQAKCWLAQLMAVIN